MNKRRN